MLERALMMFAGISALACACSKRSSDHDRDRDASIKGGRVVITIAVGSGTPAELERTVAIPLEGALARLPDVEAIETVVRGDGIELRLVVGAAADPRPVAKEAATRLRALRPDALPRGASSPRLELEPALGSVIRFQSRDARPRPVDLPIDFPQIRVRTCGPSPVRDIALDPERMAALAVTIDDVLEALDTAPDPQTLRGGQRMADIATVRDADRSDCRVVDGPTYFASVHYAKWTPDVFDAMGNAGWSISTMLGGQRELVISLDNDPSGTALSAIAARLGAQRGIDGTIALDESGPPHVGRVIFRPRFDADIRAAITAAMAAAPGTRLLDLTQEYSSPTEAIATGPDRGALIARARAAVAELNKADPDAHAACIGCEEVTELELALAESTSLVPSRLGALISRRGLLLRLADPTPIRLHLRSDAEASPELLGTLLVRRDTTRTAPLSSIAKVTTASRTAVLLRRAGQPAVIVWARGVGSAQLEQLLPKAVVRTRLDLW